MFFIDLEDILFRPMSTPSAMNRAPDCGFPNGQTASRSSKPAARQERNFWMQRPEAKNPPERPLLSAETGNVENRRQDPRRSGLFSIDHGFRSSGRLDGGVRSHMRTRLPVIWPISGSFSKKTANRRAKVSKGLQHRYFSNIAPIRYQGGTGSAQLLQHRASI
jgi:hypothetical protein